MKNSIEYLETLDRIQKNKYFTKVKNKVREYQKNDTCYFCENNKIVNSHSIQKSILSNIAEKNYLYSSRELSKTISPIYEKLGINLLYDKIAPTHNTISHLGVFRELCKKHENLLFKEYEKKIIENELFNNEACFQMELKHLLLTLNKGKIALSIFHENFDNARRDFLIDIYKPYLSGKTKKEIFNNHVFILNNIFNVKNLLEGKIDYIINDIDYIYKNDIDYEIMVDKTLDIRTNFTISNVIYPFVTLKSNNELRLMPKDYHIRFNLGVFPLKNNKTRIVIFYEKKYKKSFSKLSELLNYENKHFISNLSYVILAFGDEFFYNSNFKVDIGRFLRKKKELNYLPLISADQYFRKLIKLISTEKDINIFG